MGFSTGTAGDVDIAVARLTLHRTIEDTSFRPY